MEESMLQTNINAADNKLPGNIKKIDVKYGTISSHDDAFFFFFPAGWVGVCFLRVLHFAQQRALVELTTQLFIILFLPYVHTNKFWMQCVQIRLQKWYFVRQSEIY